MCSYVTLPRAVQILLLTGVFGCTSLRNTNTAWSSIDNDDVEKHLLVNEFKIPEDYRIYQFHAQSIIDQLEEAGEEHDLGVFLTFPDPVSEKGIYKIWKTKSKYEDLDDPFRSSYSGYCVSEFSTRILLDVFPHGFQALIITDKGKWHISPIDLKREIYVVYREKAVKQTTSIITALKEE